MLHLMTNETLLILLLMENQETDHLKIKNLSQMGLGG